MNTSEAQLSKVERRLLGELLLYREHLAHDAPSRTPSPAREHRRASLRTPTAGRIERALIAGIAVASLGLVGVTVARILGGTPKALAATPAPLSYSAADGRPATSLLLALADAAARQRPSLHTGRYAYVRTLSWALDSRIAGKLVTSTVVPSETETWTASDGSGRLLIHSLTATRGATLQQSARGALLDDSTLPRDRRPPFRVTATTPDLAARQLQVGHPFANGPVERFVALTDLTLEGPLAPRVRAAILRALATTRGLADGGTVTDRLGRHGRAISVISGYSGLPTRYTYIFGADGSLLDAEQTLLGSAGELNVRPGSVIAYSVFAASGWTNSTSARP